MKLVKASAIAFAMSAMLAGPVLAQGAASDSPTGGGAQGRSNMQGGLQGGAAGSVDEDDVRAGAPGEKAGVQAKPGAKGTVGAGSGTPKGTATGTDPATGKRY